MRIFRRLLHVDHALKSALNPLNPLLLCTILFLAPPSGALAFTLTINVDDGIGGRVISAPGDTDCGPSCLIQASSDSLVSLFALPDKGYRFKSWNGVCINTLGPLCTIMPSENISISVRFSKTENTPLPAKALLLLHGEGVKYTIWNEFIKQHFNDRCPVVYGGVVLGEDSFNAHNNVYCYRIAFGYYNMLKHSIAAKSAQKISNGLKTKERFSSKRLGYEVRAAVLGVLNRHPNLSLSLVGQARAALAAESFLQSHTTEASSVVGLLALQQSKYETLQTEGSATLKLQASPEEDVKISAALAELTKSWWMAR